MEKIRKPKILITLANFPYPAIDGTKFKILSNISLPLKHFYDLEYLIISLRKIPENDLRDFEMQYGKAHIFYKNKFSFLVASLRSFINLFPFQVNGFYSKKAKIWIKENINQYQVVYTHTIRVSEIFLGLPKYCLKKIILDFNDALSLNYNKSKIFASFPLNIVYAVEENLIRSYEKKMLSFFTNFHVVSDYDRTYLLNLDKNIDKRNIFFECIPHGVEKSSFVRKNTLDNKIYFIGSLNYEMNLNAIAFFISELWFSLKKAIPEMKLHIIGNGGENMRFKYQNLKDIDFTGYLDDISSVVDTCTCLVAPILSGAGMPTKIIESMSFGIPCVTTPIGARGIRGLKHGENIYILDEKNKELWVSTIKRLNEDLVLNCRVGQNALTLFNKSYELSFIQQKWVDFFEEVRNMNN